MVPLDARRDEDVGKEENGSPRKKEGEGIRESEGKRRRRLFETVNSYVRNVK